MARTLKSVVYVDGIPYAPGDDIPDAAAKRIGAHAWHEDGGVREPSGTRGVGDFVHPPIMRTETASGGLMETEDVGGNRGQQADAPSGDSGADAEDEGAPASGAEEPDAGQQQEPKAPPRSGKGSGADAWRAYARQLGVEPSADADRDDIIAAIDAHRLAQRAADN